MKTITISSNELELHVYGENEVVSTWGFMDKEVITDGKVYATKKKKERRIMKEYNASSFTTEDFGPQRFCKHCGIRLIEVLPDDTEELQYKHPNPLCGKLLLRPGVGINTNPDWAYMNLLHKDEKQPAKLDARNKKRKTNKILEWSKFGAKTTTLVTSSDPFVLGSDDIAAVDYYEEDKDIDFESEEKDIIPVKEQPKATIIGLEKYFEFTGHHSGVNKKLVKEEHTNAKSRREREALVWIAKNSLKLSKIIADTTSIDSKVGFKDEIDHTDTMDGIGCAVTNNTELNTHQLRYWASAMESDNFSRVWDSKTKRMIWITKPWNNQKKLIRNPIGLYKSLAKLLRNNPKKQMFRDASRAEIKWLMEVSSSDNPQVWKDLVAHKLAAKKFKIKDDGVVSLDKEKSPKYGDMWKSNVLINDCLYTFTKVPQYKSWACWSKGARVLDKMILDMGLDLIKNHCNNIRDKK